MSGIIIGGPLAGMEKVNNDPRYNALGAAQALGAKRFAEGAPREVYTWNDPEWEAIFESTYQTELVRKYFERGWDRARYYQEGRQAALAGKPKSGAYSVDMKYEAVWLRGYDEAK